MRSRDVQRFTRQVTEQQRSYSGGQPDGQIMSVTAQAPDGRYVCKKDHWDTGGILVKSTPPGSRVIFPSVRKVYFEDGDRLRPFLLGTLSEREAWPVTLGAPTLTADWRCAHANFQRNNSFTAATFDFENAEPVTSLADLAGVASGILPRFYQGHAAFVSPDYRIVEPEDEDYDAEIGEGEPYQLGPFLFQRVPDYPDFFFSHNLGAGELGYEGIDWETWAANSLCILDSGEIVLGWQDGETTDYLTVFSENPGFGWRKTLSLSGSTGQPVNLREGADTVQVGDHLCTPVTNTSTGAEYLHVLQISTDIDEADLVELTGADSKGLVGAVWGNPEDTLPQSWVAGNLCIVQDGSGGLYAVNPTITTAPAWIYAGTKRVRPLAVDGTRLVTAYEAATYQTVTDVAASTDWTDGGSTEEDREILAEGKSTTGGLAFIFAASGAEINSAEFTGEESYGTSLGPKLEERTTHEGPGFTSAAYTTDTLGYWVSGFPGAYVFARDAIWIGSDPGNAPEEGEVYPYADSPTGDALYEAIVFSSFPIDDGSDWWAETYARALAYKEALVRQFFDVYAARPSPSHFIKKEMWRLTYHSYSSAGNVHDDLHVVINSSIEGDPPAADGEAAPSIVSPSGDLYAGSEEADTLTGESPGGPGWLTGMSPKTFGWQLVKVWSNVQEEFPLTRTASPQHPLGPVCIAHGLIVHGPKGILDSGNDAHFVARRPSSPSEPEWTFTVTNSTGLLVGNVWADSARFWIQYSTNGGTDFQLVGLVPSTGLPDGGDPEIFIETGRVVFDGTNVHDEFTEWAIGPA